MERVQFIEHKGKKILFCNYADINQVDEAVRLTGEEKKMVAGNPPASLLVLTDVTNLVVDKRIDDALTEMIRSNKPYVRRSAVLGVTGFKKTVYNIMMALTGREIKIFTDLDAAKDWLVEG